MKAHADKAISDENREKIPGAKKQESSHLKEIVTKATFAKLSTAPVVKTTEAPTTTPTVSMTTTNVEVIKKTTLTSDGKKPLTFSKTLITWLRLLSNEKKNPLPPPPQISLHYLTKIKVLYLFQIRFVYLLGFRSSTKDEENQIAHGLLRVWTESGGGCGGRSLGDLCEPVA